MAHEKHPRHVRAGAEESDIALQRLRCRPRLYLDKSSLTCGDLLDKKIKVCLSLSQHSDPPPPRSRENEIDEDLKVTPVEGGDKANGKLM